MRAKIVQSNICICMYYWSIDIITLKRLNLSTNNDLEPMQHRNVLCLHTINSFTIKRECDPRSGGIVSNCMVNDLMFHLHHQRANLILVDSIACAEQWTQSGLGYTLKYPHIYLI